MFEPDEAKKAEEQKRKRLMLSLGGLATVIVLAAFLLFATTKQTVEATTLPNAMRAGNSRFDAYKPRVTLDDPEILEAENMMGMLEYTWQARLSNRGDQTLTGIEVAVRCYDAAGRIAVESIAVPVPRIREEPLKPGESMRLRLKAHPPSKYKMGSIADVKAEVVGLLMQ
ncbi:MAG: hypothetical protein ACKV2V_07800 [Blastocatellia bacterium]